MTSIFRLAAARPVAHLGFTEDTSSQQGATQQAIAQRDIQVMVKPCFFALILLAGILNTGSFQVPCNVLYRLNHRRLNCPRALGPPMSPSRLGTKKLLALAQDVCDDAERSPSVNTWTPRSGKKPLAVLIGFMGATPAIMVIPLNQLRK